MTLIFERPVGAPADVKELEYISALAQTSMDGLRANGTLTAEDVTAFLLSRHGINANPDVVQSDIMNDLAGNVGSDPSDFIDICQVVSMLLLPHFKRVADSGDNDQINNLFGKVLDLIVVELDPSNNELLDERGRLTLSAALIQDIFMRQGVTDVAPAVVEEMVHVAGSSGQALDVTSLTKAMTADLTHYNVHRESCISTHYEDALTDANIQNEEKNDLETGNRVKEVDGPYGVDALTRVFTASSIDVTAETYGSQLWVTVTWVVAVLVYFAFFWGASTLIIGCENSGLACEVGTSLVQWILIFLQLSILGVLFIGLSSIGNTVYFDHSSASIVGHVGGMVMVILATIVTFFARVHNRFIDTTRYRGFETAYYSILLGGCILLVLQTIQLIHRLLPKEQIANSPALTAFFTPSTFKMEQRTKQAAAFKVTRMIQNALELHELSSQATKEPMLTGMGNIVLAYYAKEHESEPCGGVLWGWKKIWNGSIFREEGVWIHSRLVAANASQLFVAAFVIFVWAILTFGSPTSTSTNNGVTEDSASLNGPILVGQSIGAFLAFGAALVIAIVFLPSAISTVLQFRTGVLPSLRSKPFLQYRFAEDQTTAVFGSAFWGAFFTSLLCWVICGSIALLLIYQPTRRVVVANLVGVVVTLAMKLAILLILRKVYFAAFYRKKPAAANIMGTMLECWYLGLATSFMLVRTIKLLLITSFYIGRLDTPLLAPGIGHVGPVVLDGGPFAFRKDLLLHDAHRHPYLERLGLLYLLKLRHGKSFATRAGSAWRLLFTMALMPWLRKYRPQMEGKFQANVNDVSDETRRVFEKSRSLRSDMDESDALQVENELLRTRIFQLEHENMSSRVRLEAFVSQRNLEQSKSVNPQINTEVEEDEVNAEVEEDKVNIEVEEEKVNAEVEEGEGNTEVKKDEVDNETVASRKSQAEECTFPACPY